MKSRVFITLRIITRRVLKKMIPTAFAILVHVLGKAISPMETQRVGRV